MLMTLVVMPSKIMMIWMQKPKRAPPLPHSARLRCGARAHLRPMCVQSGASREAQPESEATSKRRRE
jgi:hypothetical protein